MIRPFKPLAARPDEPIYIAKPKGRNRVAVRA